MLKARIVHHYYPVVRNGKKRVEHEVITYNINLPKGVFSDPAEKFAHLVPEKPSDE